MKTMDKYLLDRLTLKLIIKSYLSRVEENRNDPTFIPNTRNYGKTDIRRYLTQAQRKDVSMAVGRANNHRLLRFDAYKALCCVASLAAEVENALTYKKLYKRGGGGYVTLIENIRVTVEKQYSSQTWVATSDEKLPLYGDYISMECETLGQIKHNLEVIANTNWK
jgi:hypothetical protein